MSRLPLAPSPAPASPADLFAQAVVEFRRGDHAGARRRLKIVLRKQPQHFDALHLMSLIEAQRGHYKDAEKLIRQALRINPNSPDAQSNRGNMLRELDELEEAVKCYDAALQLNPKYHNAHNNRAIALARLGRFDEALKSYGEAIALAPTFAAAFYNRGMALAQMRRFGEALADYDKALALEPGTVMAHVDRANALVELGRFDDAIAAYQRILAADPNSFAALFNLGLAFSRNRRFAEAVDCFDRAIRIDPTFGQAHDGRGNALLELGRFSEALKSYEDAIAATPNLASAHNNLGLALLRLQRPADALASFDAALRIDPAFVAAHGNRAQALQSLGRGAEAKESLNRAIVLDPASIDLRANLGNTAMTERQFESAVGEFEFVVTTDPEYPYAAGNLMHCKMQICDWTGFTQNLASIEAGVRTNRRVALPFIVATMTDDPRLQLQAAKIRAADLGLASKPFVPGIACQHDRIRIAYVSADFREHPVSFLLAGVLENHDRSRFDVTAISYGSDNPTELRQRIKNAVGRFVDAQTCSEEQASSLIRELEIDIAVDLSGFTIGERAGVFARRPAPVQVSYLGYLATMGVDYIDYIIADRLVIPQSQTDLYPEKVVCLPHCFQPTDRSRQISDKNVTRAQAGLPAGGFVFCCFNSTYKITPDVFDIWMRVLKKIEGSVLWLFAESMAAQRNLRKEAAARGVISERLIFAPSIPLAEHQARLRLADLFLDTLPYNAGATASDTLWAGVPVLTRCGETFVGRMAASVLNAINLPELVATTPEAYEQMAIDLATHPERLAAIRRKLADNRLTTPLFDTAQYTRHLETAYQEMMMRQQRGERPASFAVAP